MSRRSMYIQLDLVGHRRPLSLGAPQLLAQLLDLAVGGLDTLHRPPMLLHPARDTTQPH